MPMPLSRHREPPIVSLPAGVHVNLRRRFAAELQRVADKVLEQLGQLRGVGPDGRQFTMCDFGSCLLDARVEVVQGLPERRAGVGRHRFPAASAHPCVSQQVLDQSLHPLGAIHGVLDERVGLRVQLIRILLLKQLHEAAHRPQRLLEVVRGHGGELLQVLVGAGEVFGGSAPTPMFAARRVLRGVGW